jgi:hypothetical protein
MPLGRRPKPTPTRLQHGMALSASASAALFFAEPFFVERLGLLLLLFRSGLWRRFQVFSEVVGLVQFALARWNQFLKQIPASFPTIC